MDKNMKSTARIVPFLVSAGVFDSTLIYSSDTVRTKNRRVSLFEVELPIGENGYSHIGAERYKIRENNILLAKPGQVRYTELPYKCFFLHLLVEDPYYASVLSALPDIMPITERGIFSDCFNSLIAATVRPSPENELWIQSKLFEILYLLLRENTVSVGKNSVHRSNTDIIKQAVAYIDAHFDEDITLADIAGHVHLSSVYFHNLFKAAVGKTPHRYLLDKRLSHAGKLLAATGMSFVEIASACGFPSQSYFNSVFKRELQITPRQYRMNVALSWEEE